MPKQAVINLIGTLPDNTIPNISDMDEGSDDGVFIYFRTNNKLYAYDTKLNTEFDLFNMPLPIT